MGEQPGIPVAEHRAKLPQRHGFHVLFVRTYRAVSKRPADSEVDDVALVDPEQELGPFRRLAWRDEHQLGLAPAGPHERG